MRAVETLKRRLVLGGLGLGGVLLAGTGLWLALFSGNVVVRFLVTGLGARTVLVILVSNLGLAGLRAIVNWRRKSRGRPAADLAPYVYPVVLLDLMTLVALVLLGLEWISMYLVGAELASTLLIALVNVLVGAVLLVFAGRAIGEVIVLTQLILRTR